MSIVKILVTGNQHLPVVIIKSYTTKVSNPTDIVIETDWQDHKQRYYIMQKVFNKSWMVPYWSGVTIFSLFLTNVFKISLKWPSYKTE